MNDNCFETNYILETKRNERILDYKPGIVGWKSPSNIALVKYWGKKSNQLPKNPSISFSLNKSVTELMLHYRAALNDRSDVEFYLEEFGCGPWGHYYMGMPVDFDRDGNWEVISGVDMHGIYYWKK